MTSKAPVNEIEYLKIVLIERVFKWVFYCALIALSSLIWRVRLTGWINAYTAQLVGMGLFSIAFFTRKKLSWKMQSFIIHTVFWRFGLIGLFSFGILSGGLIILLLDCILISTLHSIRHAIVALIAAGIAIGIAGFGFINGYLTPPISAATYILETQAWLGAVYIPLMISTVVIMAAASYRHSVHDILALQEEKIKLLEEEITKIQTENQINSDSKQAQS